MLNYDEKASKSDLYARVKLAPINAIQRTMAVNALRDADAISDGILWAVNAVSRLFTRTNKRVGRTSAQAQRLQHGH